ncbi:SOS response-associated peptidase [Acidisoma cellulosilytica]|uniref:Abasic site processing protein n=1 Tax=Acidisoma cellulosilyticum TaxID=2802395 RepID=A0A964E6E1_9PROT|nr:SOS response-associated peptidase [Acidisoma cellulosilyticum]MCB8883397.1 SOS response-associated peptidase [Acidisoma cellulosilyticum]
MCGRFASTLPPEQIEALFAVRGDLPGQAPSWNITPRQDALVIRRHPETRARRADALNWGFLPHFAKQLPGAPLSGQTRPINARAETLPTAPLFRGAYQGGRRCLVPATLFYEWHTGTEGRQPYAVARKDGSPLVFGGLWEGWRGPDGTVIRSFVIVTTVAGADIAALHERMPLVLSPEDWPLWLGEIDRDPTPLLQPTPANTLRAWPVSSRVNSAQQNDAGLADEVDPAMPSPRPATAARTLQQGPSLPLFS